MKCLHHGRKSVVLGDAVNVGKLAMKKIQARFRFAGERRQVTALFYDIVGSTELLLRTEPEQFFRSVSALHQSADAIIAKHGGFVHQRLGDGGCCYFGFPNQSEDAAESAVRASLELVGSLTRPKSRTGRPLKLRIGIATSFVVFSAEGDEIVGAAPILAARLQGEADPNSVLVADSTVRLTQTAFDYAFIREANLKGFDEPVALWRPKDRHPAAANEQSIASERPPLRGRTSELAILSDAWRSALDGRGSSIALTGEAGIGKSRVVDEFISSTKTRPQDLAILQCGRRLEGQPLFPFTAFIDRLGASPALRDGGIAAFNDALVLSGRPVDRKLVEPLANFTASATTAMSSSLRTSDLSGRAFRQSVIEAAAHVLTCNAPASPALIVFEDVHWADGMTLGLLERLRALAAEQPILVIQTSRLAGAPAGATEITLSGLASDAVRDLVASIWGKPAPPGLSDFILDQSDGMPLYGEELASFFRSRNALAGSPAEWKRQLTEGGVTSLNDLLAARLAGSGSARLAAQIASVIGREFSLPLLMHLLDSIARQPPDHPVARLIAEGIIERVSEARDTFRFRHVLMQEAAYGSLLKTDRRRIHRLIAERLIDEETPSLPAAIAAWQCAEAGLHEDAARFALEAAEASVSRSAMNEAGISIALCADELKRVTAARNGRADLRLRLLEVQGVVATALEGEGSKAAQRVYSRAMQLLRTQPPPVRARHFPVYWGWWFTAPTVLEQQTRARILVADMQSVKDDETQLQSFHCGWATSFHAGEHEFCLDCVSRGLHHYDPERAVRNRAFFGGHDAKVCGLGESALSYLLLGRPDDSENAIATCLDWAEATNHAGTMVHALYYAIVLRRCQDRFDDVHALGEQMHSLAGRHGLSASQARANMYCGWAELMRSAGRHGADRFQDGLTLQQQLGTDDNLSMHSDMHAQVLQLTGRPAEAMKALQTAIAAGSASGQLFWLAELYRRRANLKRQLQHRAPEVFRDFAKAVRIAETQKAVWLAGRAKRDLAELAGL